MRYLIYKRDRVDHTALKEQYTRLTAEQERARRKEKRQRVFATIVFCMVFLGSLVGCGFLIAAIPDPRHIITGILYGVGVIGLGFLSLIVSILLGVLAAAPLYKKADKSAHAAKQVLLSKACDDLRKYYELQEPCIVTKCYEASDRRFNRHDVCLFVAGEELRVTTNLKNGFFDGEKDLGCYAFRAEELAFSECQIKDHTAIELNAGEVTFLLGRRAKGLMESFLSKQ